jgi:Mrp family chromosome partitioning ATPase
MLSRENDTKMTTAIPLSSQLASRVPVEMLDHARDIGLTLLRSFVDRPSYILGVTSALPHEGKTTTGMALAEVMATDFGLDTILLDTHAERPWAPLNDVNEAPLGLTDWLAGDSSLSDTLVYVHDKCTVLPVGTEQMTSRDVLQYLVKSEPLLELRERYSLIILDLPDLVNPAAAALANLCDGIVLVVRSGVTPSDRVKEFLPLLESVTIHGVVLNRDKPKVPAFLRRMFA